MTDKPLTIKQENFAVEYIRNEEKGIDAYKYAYDAENMSDESIYVEASRLLYSPNIALRIKELRAKLNKRNEVTLDTFNDELVKARDMAKASGDYKELRINAMDRAKLHGVIIDKKEIKADIVTESHDEYIKRVMSDE